MSDNFVIVVRLERVTRHIFVDRIPGDGRHEFYQLTYKSWRALLKTDRPFWLNKGLKHRRWNWDLVEGEFRYRSNQDAVIESLEEYLRK